MGSRWGITDLLVLAIFVILLLHWLGVAPD